jgi:hypothetical protein
MAQERLKSTPPSVDRSIDHAPRSSNFLATVLGLGIELPARQPAVARLPLGRRTWLCFWTSAPMRLTTLPVEIRRIGEWSFRARSTLLRRGSAVSMAAHAASRLESNTAFARRVANVTQLLVVEILL